MIHNKVNGYSVYRFSDFEEYLDRASNPVWKHDKSGCSEWGTPTFDKMLHNARHGWANSLDDINKWSNLLVEDISSHLPKPEYHFDKTGTFWDLDRYLEGDPDCWLNEEPSQDIDRHNKGNLVRMVINTASSAGVRTNSHTNRCGAILALTQLLEMCGMHIQFEITTAISLGNKKLEFRTVAKAAGEALNLAVISFWCSAEMERHIDFAICETMQECQSTVGTRYGYPIHTTDRGDICFDAMQLDNSDKVNWNDSGSVRHYVLAQLKKQGITLQK